MTSRVCKIFNFTRRIEVLNCHILLFVFCFLFFFLPKPENINESYVLHGGFSSCSPNFISFIHNDSENIAYTVNSVNASCCWSVAISSSFSFLETKLVLYRIFHGNTFNLFGFAHVRLMRAFRSCSTLLGLSVKVVFFNWSTLGLKL